MADMVECPFEDDDFVLDVNALCPVCGMFGLFIYANPMDDSCVGNAAKREKVLPDPVGGSRE